MTLPVPLSGKVAIVTGASSGIGLASAVELASLGATVACVVRRSSQTDALSTAFERAGAQYSVFYADLENPSQTAGIVPEIGDQLGRVDILVNSAGVTDSGGFLEQTLDAFDHNLALNLRSPFVLSQAAGRAMIEGGQGGRIVNLSSSAAFRALHANPGYVSSKGGLNALTRSAAGALGPYDITVNAVVPGPTLTPMSRVHMSDEDLHQVVRNGPLQNLLGRVSEPEDVASVVAFLCTPAARQITGQMLHVSAGAVV